MTPQEFAARLVAIQAALADIDTQAAKVVAVIITKRSVLTDLAAQRQALVSEADQMMRPILSADWRDTLRDSGDLSSP